MIQKAIKLDNFKDIQQNIKNYDLLYIGNEFCQKYLPGYNTLINYKKLIKIPKILLTPILTDVFLKEIIKILKINEKEKLFDEITINDIGLLNWIFKNKVKIKINVGRLLVINMLSSLNSNILKKDFKNNNINSFEIDDIEHFDIFNKKEQNIYFHLPYKYMASSRYTCDLSIDIKNNNINLFKDKYYKFKSTFNNEVFYLKENAYFIRNELKVIPPNIKRIIYHP